MSLYQFTQGHTFLDSIGVPKLATYEDNVVIAHHDFVKEEAKGEMEWREDGIYLKIDGVYRRGFLYKKKYGVDKWGLPKFHVAKCSTLQEFEAKGILHTAYYWSNAPKVLVTQWGGGKPHPDSILTLCKNCVDTVVSNDIVGGATTESEFPEREVTIAPTSETDIFSRPLNWSVISRNYRQRKNYTCESCGTGGEDLRSASDRRFIDADHIIAHELTNTSDENLRCLCVLCHYFKDNLHEVKLDKPHIRMRVAAFVSNYTDILKRKNPSLFQKFRTKFPV